TLPPGFCSDVKVREVNQEYVRYDATTGQFTREGAYQPVEAKATEILFEGVGKVIIGKTKRCGCMYNWIQVEMEPNLPPGEGAAKLQRMLSMMGLGPVLGEQPKENEEKMKIFQLYRAYFPSDATSLTANKVIFERPIEKIKEELIRTQ